MDPLTIILAVVALAAVIFALVRDRDEKPVALGESRRRMMERRRDR